MGKYTEKDLDDLIVGHLKEYKSGELAKFKKTKDGVWRIQNRVKKLIFDRGYRDVGACLAEVEYQLSYENRYGIIPSYYNEE